MKFSPNGSPISLVFAGKFHPEILTSSPGGNVQQRSGGKTSHVPVLALNANTSKRLEIRPNLLLMNNIKSHAYALSIDLKIDDLG